MTAPDDLGKSGAALWSAITDGLPDDWELDEREMAILELAARQADSVAELEAVAAKAGPMAEGSNGQPVLHPAIAEIRQGRLAIDRLLGKIVMPASDKADEGENANRLRARKAATAMHGRRQLREARRGA